LPFLAYLEIQLKLLQQVVSFDISVNDLASDFVKSSIDIRLESTNFIRSILKD